MRRSLARSSSSKVRPSAVKIACSRCTYSSTCEGMAGNRSWPVPASRRGSRRTTALRRTTAFSSGSGLAERFAFASLPGRLMRSALYQKGSTFPREPKPPGGTLIDDGVFAKRDPEALVRPRRDAVDGGGAGVCGRKRFGRLDWLGWLEPSRWGWRGARRSGRRTWSGCDRDRESQDRHGHRRGVAGAHRQGDRKEQHQRELERGREQRLWLGGQHRQVPRGGD